LQRLDAVEPIESPERAHLAALAADIGRHLSRPSQPREMGKSALPEPPGEPIGGGFETFDTFEILGDCSFADGQ